LGGGPFPSGLDEDDPSITAVAPLVFDKHG
jgi:hypothetical protein